MCLTLWAWKMAPGWAIQPHQAEEQAYLSHVMALNSYIYIQLYISNVIVNAELPIIIYQLC